MKTDNNLINNPLYSKAKKQLLMEKEYKNLYRSVEGLNSLGLNTVKEKISPENYKSTQSPKKKNMLGAFSDENRCRKELMGIKKKENNNMQKSYDISKNTFKEFLMEHSRDQDPNKFFFFFFISIVYIFFRTDRMIVLQNYLKENKDNKTMKKK